MTQRRILSVEDNPVLQLMLRRLLVASDFEVLEAADGDEAVRMAEQERPDLILMDVQLPTISGLEAARAIKAQPELSAIPIVAVTGFALDGDDERCRAAGCDDYVSKPYDLDHLLAIIQRLLD